MDYSGWKDKAKGMFIVCNDRGLHTRPATELVKCASNFKSQLRLAYQKREVNAKSLLSVLTLVAIKGAKIRVEAFGAADAEEAVAEILELASKNFNVHY